MKLKFYLLSFLFPIELFKNIKYQATITLKKVNPACVGTHPQSRFEDEFDRKNDVAFFQDAKSCLSSTVAQTGSRTSDLVTFSCLIIAYGQFKTCH